MKTGTDFNQTPNTPVFLFPACGDQVTGVLCWSLQLVVPKHSFLSAQALAFVTGMCLHVCTTLCNNKQTVTLTITPSFSCFLACFYIKWDA
jgi:hypothetical protein